MSDRYEVVLTVNASGAQRGFQAVNTEATKLAGSLEKVGTTGSAGLQKAGAAANAATGSFSRLGSSLGAVERFAGGAALGTLIGFLSDSSRAAADAEASTARLSQALENANTSIEAHAAALERAGQQAIALGFDDEDAADAIATMVGITGDATGAMENLALAQDIARARGIDLATAATLVGRVMAGNTSILSRYGIVVEEGATAQEALGQLQQRFGGQAEAYANTQRGAIDRLAVGWGNLQEEIGGVAGPMQAVLGILPGVTSGMQLAAGAASALAGSAGVGALVAAINPLTLAIGGATLAIGFLVKGLIDYQTAAAAAVDPTDTLRSAIVQMQQAGTDTSGPVAIMEAWTEAAEKGAQAGAELDRIREQQSATLNVDLRRELDAQAESQQRATLSTERRAAIEEDLGRIMAHQGSNRALVISDTLKLVDAYNDGTISGEALESGVERINSQLDTYGVVIQDATGKTAAFTQAQRDAAAAFFDRARAQAAALSNDPAATGLSFPSPEEAEANRIGLAEASQARAVERNQALLDQQIRDTERAGREQARAAQVAGRTQVREAEASERRVSRAAEATADAQISAAQAAEEAQVTAARSAADAQVESAERAADAQVRAAERAGHAQVREAEAAAHAQVRAANLAATRAGREADRLEASVRESAQAQAEATISEARKAHEALVEQADDRAEAEIAAAKRSTEEQLKQLERRSAAAARDATAEANRELQKANDEAARRIRRGASPGSVVGDLVRDQKRIFEEEARTQERLVASQDRRETAIRASEERRINAANAQKEAAAEESAARLAAIEERAQAEAQRRIEASAREAERIRTEASRNAARVERETAREVTQVQRQSARETSRVQTQAAEQVAAVREQTAAQVAATEKAAAEETARVTAQASLEADRAIRLSARETAAVRREVARSVTAEARETERLVARLGRVQVTADFTTFNEQIAQLAGKTVATVGVRVAPSTARALGGIIPAANGRVVRVGEAGPENVILPGGSLVVPHPASAAQPGGSGITIQINGDVYGLEDFRAKVGQAAAQVLGQALPMAVSERRRALGAA